MKTRDFIKALAEKLDISHKEAESLLEHTTAVIRDIVVEEKKLTITRLGSFQLKKTASKTSYIPALNKKALVPPKSSIHFQPADTLKDKLKYTSQP